MQVPISIFNFLAWLLFGIFFALPSSSPHIMNGRGNLLFLYLITLDINRWSVDL